MEEKRILIIEDDQDISEVSAIILRGEGYHVSTCLSGSAVHGYLKSINPDLILLDINLPGINGKKICEYIKSQIGLNQIPVLLMSANLDIHEAAKSCGADGIIKKPFDLHVLLDTVAEYLNKTVSHHSSNGG